ncbi:TrmB family transcriptional regulator [Haloglomus litoreum]|uniref:TrmB family transcriptional regulator n=1 Tax=Haloglomus litoreum TaxID=3034026 RepID=UPI0023E7B39E|nr:helix-turn-helix domain-containing protein [Haloglomus sp. DT116]
MSTDHTPGEAVDILQELGLKEYEARCFVGLSRLSTATAKRLSEVTEVPRTRVYDAVRVLEAQGLVEVQHSSPQRFRAVSLDEATETLRGRYATRIEELRESLAALDRIDADDEAPEQEVWGLSGRDVIAARTRELIGAAESEVVLVVADRSVLTDALVDRLNGLDDGIDLIIGAGSPAIDDALRERVPRATIFMSGLEWIRGMDDEEVTIGRLLLVDRSALLVSSMATDSHGEQAVFGRGFGNGLVIVARRLMAQGLPADRDSGSGG